MINQRKTLTRVVQDAIDKGATTVEETHKSIASLPLRVLEGSKLLRGPAREVRHLQDQTIGAIYGLIRKINQQVGTVASELLERSGNRRDTHAEANGNRPVTS